MSRYTTEWLARPKAYLCQFSQYLVAGGPEVKCLKRYFNQKVYSYIYSLQFENCSSVFKI